MKVFLRFWQQTIAGFGLARGASFAAAIAYNMLFSIFPLALFLVGISGYLLSNAQRDQLVANLTDALGSGSSANIRPQIEAATSGRGALGAIGLVGALWSASAVFGAIRIGLNVIWARKREASLLVTKAKDLAGVIGLGVMLGLSVASTALLTVVANVTESVLGKDVGRLIAFPLGLALIVLPLVLVFVAFGSLYVWASPARIHWRHVWPGALFGAVGFALLSFGFSLYARYFGHYDKVYGTLGAVIAFLFYAYLIGTIILFGAEIVEQYSLLKLAGRAGAAADETPRAVAAYGAAALGQLPLLRLAKEARLPKHLKVETITAGEVFPEDAYTFAEPPPRPAPVRRR